MLANCEWIKYPPPPTPSRNIRTVACVFVLIVSCWIVVFSTQWSQSSLRTENLHRITILYLFTCTVVQFSSTAWYFSSFSSFVELQFLIMRTRHHNTCFYEDSRFLSMRAGSFLSLLRERMETIKKTECILQKLLREQTYPGKIENEESRQTLLRFGQLGCKWEKRFRANRTKRRENFKTFFLFQRTFQLQCGRPRRRDYVHRDDAK